MVLELVAEERARDVDLLAADDRNLLAGKDLYSRILSQRRALR